MSSQIETPNYLGWYYFHCEDCDETVDFWKHEHIKDTGHDGHKIRQLSESEFIGALESCASVNFFDDDKSSCLNEEFVSSKIGLIQSQLEFVLSLVRYAEKHDPKDTKWNKVSRDDRKIELLIQQHAIQEELESIAKSECKVFFMKYTPKELEELWAGSDESYRLDILEKNPDVIDQVNHLADKGGLNYGEIMQEIIESDYNSWRWIEFQMLERFCKEEDVN